MLYLSSTRRPAGVRGSGAVPSTVIGLGLVSLVTDISAEMVTAVLPMYLMYGLGVGFLTLGTIEALYAGATATLRLAGGYASDRLRRPKTVATIGYALSAATKLGLPAVGGSVAGIGAMLGLDRAGKGIRTGPRDALITIAAPPDVLGRAFGVHRAMDTTGALLGPLVAVALVAHTTGYDTVFAVSFCLGMVGVVLLALCVPMPAMAAPAVERGADKRRVTLRQAAAVLARPGIRRACLAAGALGLVTVGDMVLYVALQQRSDLSTTLLPLLPLGTGVVFLLAATPVGRLADRVGRWRVFLSGHVLLLAAYLCLGFIPGGPLAAVLVLALHGLFYAATDGVLMAYAGPLIPEALRATGLAAVQTVQALARAGGALVVGVTLQFASAQTAFTCLAVLLGCAVLVGARLGKGSRT
ncbi:MFS transporter [Streptomyces sp. NPDC059037]|uniref:MFS transporter n=1 Tax=Streptomyces sp. NPDC059037 TaxID=3346710 RepID=UPI00367709C8